MPTIIRKLRAECSPEHKAAVATAAGCSVFFLLVWTVPGTANNVHWFAFNHPFVFVCLVGIVLGVVTSALQGSYELRGIGTARYIGAIYLLGFALWAVVYLLSPVFLDHAEPQIACVSAVFDRGGPLYHGIDSAARYSLLYGPITWLVPAFFFKLIGPSTFATKLGGALAGLGAVGLTYLALRRRGKWCRAGVWAGCFVALLLMFRHKAFWPRPEPYLVLCSALALCALTTRSWALSATLCGLAIGVAVNLKIHGVFYIAPALGVMLDRRRYAAVVLAGLLALMVGYAPYLLPNVSLHNMIVWLRAASMQGLKKGELLHNVEWIAFLSIPLVSLIAYRTHFAVGRLKQMIGRNVFVLCTSVLSLLAVTIIACKPGAGPHHFMPFLPYIVFAVASEHGTNANGQPCSEGLWKKFTAVISLSFCLTVFVLSLCCVQKDVSAALSARPRAVSICADLRTILRNYPGMKISMGLGSGNGYRYTYSRPLLVFQGQPYLLDFAALMDMRKAGLEIPDSTLEELRSGAVDMWLIPKGEKPFVMPSWYEAEDYFGEEFRNVFERYYYVGAQSAFFDIWFYRAGGAHIARDPSK